MSAGRAGPTLRFARTRLGVLVEGDDVHVAYDGAHADDHHNQDKEPGAEAQQEQEAREQAGGGEVDHSVCADSTSSPGKANNALAVPRTSYCRCYSADPTGGARHQT